MGLKLNKKLLDIFKTTKTTSDEHTYTCSYINDLVEDVYSTSEVKTNKVSIDNKPIYRKTFSISEITGSGDYLTSKTNTNLPSTYEITDVNGIYKCGNSRIALNYANPGAALAMVGTLVFIEDSVYKIFIICGRDNIVSSGHVNIEYTKN